MFEPVPDKEIKPEPFLAKAFKRTFRAMYDVVETFVIAGAVVIFVYLFVASPHEVIGISMEDNFINGEYLLADKITYHLNTPQRGDVIIFKHSDTTDYIKRVIGLPGDTVELRDGSVYINDTRLDESTYLADGTYTDPGSYLREGQQITVSNGKFFVMGDNRNHSSDSRTFGPIDESQIKGRAVFIYWPFSKLSLVPRQDYTNVQ